MSKLFLGIIFFLHFFITAQVNLQLTEKDSFFHKKNISSTESVRIIHADITQKKTSIFDGNTFLSGNVHLEHQGSTLKADTIVLYQQQNFVKAINNVELLTSDGNRITAKEIEYDGETQRGIAKNNVTFTDSKQTIKTDILYYDKVSNTAYFNTGATITDENNSMYSNTGTYYINDKRTEFSGNYSINNAEYLIEGNNIKQYSESNIADFFGPTTITSKSNPKNFIYTDKGRYFMESKEFFLYKNSKIFYNDKVLSGNEIYYNQNTGFGKAEGNVLLEDPKEKRFIKGGYGEIFEKKDSALITKQPYAVKILKKDSIYLSAEKIIVFQKRDKEIRKKSFLRAFHKGRMFKSNAQARTDSISFNETDGILHLIRKPILWSGEKQITGDTIRVFFNSKLEKIDSLQVYNNAFAISKADSTNLKDEFNQVKGRKITAYYKDNEIHSAKVIGNAQSISYADNQNEKTKKTDRIGITLSSCGNIETLFEEKNIQIISCNTDASSDIYPMSKIPPDKRKFTDFNWNTRDRLRKWQDIFLDSPEYPEKQYESDTKLFDIAEQEKKKREKKNQPKKMKRNRR